MIYTRLGRIKMNLDESRQSLDRIKNEFKHKIRYTIQMNLDRICTEVRQNLDRIQNEVRQNLTELGQYLDRIKT